MISPSHTDGQAAPEGTRYYIGLSGGMRGSMRASARAPGEHFDVSSFTPLGSADGRWTWYQVSPEIAEEWMRDDEEDTP